MPELLALVDRAASDPTFLTQLRRDPMGAARSAGFDVSHDQVRSLLGAPDASEGQLAEVLQARLSYSSKSDTSTVNYSDNTSACAGCASGT